MTDTMISTREVPWMKLGRLVEKPMNAAEAAELGGLNFSVQKQPLFFKSTDDEMKPISDRVAIVREDTGQPLGIMAANYTMLQYADAFDFMDSVGSEYVAAGCLKGGRQGFMVVKSPIELNVLDGEDPHEAYLILRTSHDGSRAVEASVQALRNRCMNQLGLRSFTAGVEHRWSVKHTSTMQGKMLEAKSSILKLGEYVKEFEHTAEKLAELHVTDTQAIDVLEKVLPNSARREEKITKIINTFHTSDKVGFDYTGWGLLNAVSEHYEWGRTGGTPESRFIGALEGQTLHAINGTASRLLQLV